MNKLLLITSFLLLSKLITGQVDTINSLNEVLDLTKLPFGSSAYTVYYEDSAKNKMGSTEMWQRDCHLKNQSEKILFQWNWYRDDSLLMQTINFCDKKSLAPEFRNLTYKQQAQVAFSVDQDSIRPADSIADNRAAYFPVRANKTGLLNWELDLETFPCLPFREVGQVFEISFFDFNEKSTNYHQYVVEKEEAIVIAGISIDCWVLKITYDATSYSQFWISKEKPETLKMKEFANNAYRYKIKLY